MTPTTTTTGPDRVAVPAPAGPAAPVPTLDDVRAMVDAGDVDGAARAMRAMSGSDAIAAARIVYAAAAAFPHIPPAGDVGTSFRPADHPSGTFTCRGCGADLPFTRFPTVTPHGPAVRGTECRRCRDGRLVPGRPARSAARDVAGARPGAHVDPPTPDAAPTAPDAAPDATPTPTPDAAPTAPTPAGRRGKKTAA